MKSSLSIIIFTVLAFLTPTFAFAHEAYVLSPEKFHEGFSQTGFDSVASLQDPHNFKVFLTTSLTGGADD